MKPLDLRSALVGVAAAAVVVLCAGFRLDDEEQADAGPTPGRYQMLMGQNLNTVVQLDTASGDAWRVIYVQPADRWIYERIGNPTEER